MKNGARKRFSASNARPVRGSRWPDVARSTALTKRLRALLAWLSTASIWIAGLDKPVRIASKARSPFSIADSVPGISRACAR